MTYTHEGPFASCPWPSICRCTHMACVDGWLNGVAEDGSDYARPCPNCRPEVAQHLADRTKPLQRLRRELPTLPRPSRSPNRAPQDAR